MLRREFITILGGTAVAWPFAARAQQAMMPVIGFLGGGSPETDGNLVAGFRQGLSRSAMSSGGTYLSNTAGRKIKMIDCRLWSPI
jgi:putative ABC transport system substrate-binding protein